MYVVYQALMRYELKGDEAYADYVATAGDVLADSVKLLCAQYAAHVVPVVRKILENAGAKSRETAMRHPALRKELDSWFSIRARVPGRSSSMYAFMKLFRPYDNPANTDDFLRESPEIRCRAEECLDSLIRVLFEEKLDSALKSDGRSRYWLI